MPRTTPFSVAKSVLLDTGFLISIFDERRDAHPNALALYRFFIEHRFTMYLSSIVVAEFCTRNDIELLPMSNFLPLDFDLYDGVKAGALNFKAFIEVGDKDRSSVKDDVKLIAQMQNHSIGYIATQDDELRGKLARKGIGGFSVILSTDSIQQHFAVHRGVGGVTIAAPSLPGQGGLFL